MSARIGSGIVVYNSDLHLLRQVVEAIKQHLPAQSIVIVDNASTIEYAEDLAMLDVRIIRANENRGFGAGHNLAVKNLPDIDYYIAVNPDAIIRNSSDNGESLKAAIEYMEENRDIGILVPKILNPDGTLQPQCKRLPNVLDLILRRFLPKRILECAGIKARLARYSMLDMDYDKIMEPDFASGCFMIFRKAAFEMVSGFDERYFLYFEDADISRRVARNHRIVYYPALRVSHVWGRAGHKKVSMTLVMIRSAIQYFNKWGWKWW